MRKAKLPTKRSVIKAVKKHKAHIGIVIVGVSGALLLSSILAAPFTRNFEAENQSATRTGPATIGSSSGASGGQFLKFGNGQNQFVSQCLARSGSELAINGLMKSRYNNTSVAANTKMNASTAYWDGTDTNGDPISWVVTVDGDSPACWYGGKYQGVWNDTLPNITWEDPYHHAGAMTIRMSNFLVEALRADNQGDGVRMEVGGSNFHIRGVYMSNIHDDCVENDFNHTGTTEDSLFDGCYAGFSATNFNSDDSSNRVWRIEKNLVRMKPFPTVHNPQFFIDRGCDPSANHMALFKGWNEPNKGPKLVLKNNIIKYDISPCGSSPVIGENIDLDECSNNVIVYTGGGTFPKAYPTECFTLTTDISVWNNAVNSWKQTHPEASN